MYHPDGKHRGSRPDVKQVILNVLRTGLAALALASCGLPKAPTYPEAADYQPEAQQTQAALLGDVTLGAASLYGAGNPCSNLLVPLGTPFINIYSQTGKDGIQEQAYEIGHCGQDPEWGTNSFVKREGQEEGIRTLDNGPVVVSINQGPIICDQGKVGTHVVEVYPDGQTQHEAVKISECTEASIGNPAPWTDESFIVATDENWRAVQQNRLEQQGAQALVGLSISATAQTLTTDQLLTLPAAYRLPQVDGQQIAAALTTIGKSTIVIPIIVYGSIGGIQDSFEGGREFWMLDGNGNYLYTYRYNASVYPPKITIIDISPQARMITDATGRLVLVNADAVEGEATNMNPQGNPDSSEIEPTPSLPEQQPNDKQEKKDEIPPPHLSERQQQHDSIINGDRFMKDEFITAYQLARTTRNETNAEIIKQATPLRGLNDIELTKAIFDTKTNRLLVGSWNASHEQIVAAYEGPGGIQNYNLGYSSRYFSGILYTVGKQQRPVFILDNDTGLDFNRMYTLQQKEFDLMSPRGEWFVLRFDPLGYVRIPSALYGSLR